jgi:beta-glucosidase
MAFRFATGIENSYPIIANNVRVDQMAKCGHYEHWRNDLVLVHDMGIKYLRWGPALYKTFVGPGQYDLAWTDGVVAEMKRLAIEPIFDLLHFGLPDWLGDFQNSDFPRFFAEYAGECARRYPHVKFWTPVNEMFITALFSAKYGWWNERLKSDAALLRAIVNVAKANVLAMDAITREIPDAAFVQVESCEYAHPAEPGLFPAAELYNDLRFLPLDLTLSQPISPRMTQFLLENSIPEEDVAFFRLHLHHHKPRCIIGTDYYATNEHLFMTDGTSCSAGDLHGYYAVAKEYWERYRLPLWHTETNRREEEGAVEWLWKQWHQLLRLRKDGIPVLGFTWFSLTDQMDWDTALREEANRVHPVGLYDLNRRPRDVGKLYRRLINEWASVLTAENPVQPVFAAAA